MSSRNLFLPVPVNSGWKMHVLNLEFIIPVVSKLNTWSKLVSSEKLMKTHIILLQSSGIRESKLWCFERVVCSFDKHKGKVGEPNYPVAAAKRGRKVLVHLNKTFEVGDHDFTKFSLIPLVTLSVDNPTDITDTDDVFTGLKGVFEPSSPHMTGTWPSYWT